MTDITTILRKLHYSLRDNVAFLGIYGFIVNPQVTSFVTRHREGVFSCVYYRTTHRIGDIHFTYRTRPVDGDTSGVIVYEYVIGDVAKDCSFVVDYFEEIAKFIKHIQ